MADSLSSGFDRSAVAGFRAYEPRLSVVIPHYNHERFLGEALAAIMEQSRTPDEVVLVDDASSAESMKIVETVLARYPTVRFLPRASNGGVLAACETGFAAATGEYIAFMSADDRLAPGAIERVAGVLAVHGNTGLVFSDAAEMEEGGENPLLNSLWLADHSRHFSPQEFQRLLASSFFYISTESVWFKATALRAFGGFDERLRWHADLYAAYGVGMAYGATYVPGAHSYFRRSATSYSSSRFNSEVQVEVLEAWLAKTREATDWDARTAFRIAAVLPDYGRAAVRALCSDSEFVSTRLIWRILSRNLWRSLRSVLPSSIRRWVRRVLSLRTSRFCYF